MTATWHLPFALALGLSLTFEEVAGQTVKLITERSTLTQEVSADYSGGEATQFAQKVLEEAGIAHELLYLPWRRAYDLGSTEPNALIFPIARTAQREDNFQWVGELIPVNYYLFRLKSRQHISVNTLDDARPYQIGVVNYHVHHEFLLSLGFTNLQPVNGNLQNLKKALLHRIDLFPLSDGGIILLCINENIDCSQFEPVLKLNEISGGLYMAFSSTTNSAVVQAARESFNRLVDNETHRKTFQSRLDHAQQFDTFWPVADEGEVDGRP